MGWSRSSPAAFILLLLKSGGVQMRGERFSASSSSGPGLRYFESVLFFVQHFNSDGIPRFKTPAGILQAATNQEPIRKAILPAGARTFFKNILLRTLS